MYWEHLLVNLKYRADNSLEHSYIFLKAPVISQINILKILFQALELVYPYEEDHYMSLQWYARLLTMGIQTKVIATNRFITCEDQLTPFSSFLKKAQSIINRNNKYIFYEYFLVFPTEQHRDNYLMEYLLLDHQDMSILFPTRINKHKENNLLKINFGVPS